MRAALVTELGETPEMQDIAPPVREAGQTLVQMTAAALNPVDLAIAAGQFYGGHPPLPFAAGRDAVGLVLESDRFASGTRVHTITAASGVLAEQFVVADDDVWEIADGDDHVEAAALGIAGLAGWMAVEERARLQSGEQALILGATGTVGMVAVQAARLLGAWRVVAAGRDRARLERAAELGADATVHLDGSADHDALAAAFPEGGPDVVVDPLWGEPAKAAMQIAAPSARVVQLGQSASAELALPSALLRGKRLQIIGHTVFAYRAAELAPAHHTLLAHVRAGRLTVDTETFSLDRAAEAWELQRSGPHHKLIVR